ncbi:PQQ-like beta-propeller repeat protein [Streptomyces sp. DK15]|uniref:outer membrane protein assembly factor BamB family protein n=1 Tax=Streptomyces sp. DK15 TaxID=2957499 RepID=UPI0029B9C44F|nr:PQQ-binding-like beta-propeller repeat protein [Streptomyces sp. DK15]MDX2393762.1 PQQ-like beta-propeller repeat protein [Streptomyces sp. DK15]
MTKDKHALLVFASGTALALGLTTGCGPAEKTGSEPVPATGRPSASAKGPVYAGLPDPGLQGEPVWARATSGGPRTVCPGPAEDTRTTATRCVLGDAVVLTEEVPGAGGEGEPQRFITRLLDAATGTQRAEYESVMSVVPSSGLRTGFNEGSSSPSGVGRWKDGSPALLIRSQPVPAGASAGQDPSSAVYTMYSPAGEKLGSSEVKNEHPLALPVVDGFVQLDEESEKLTYRPIGGGADIPVTKIPGGDQPIGPGFGHYAEKKDDHDGKGRYLAVIDRLTGKEAWTTREMAPPPSIVAEGRPGKHADTELRPLSGNRAILLWHAQTSDATVMTTVDLATGRRVADGPSIDLGLTLTRTDDRTVVSPDGKTAVSQLGGKVVAWETETGRELWRPKAGQDLRPMAQSPGGVLYAEQSPDTKGFDALTGTPLSPYEQIPEFTGNGYGTLMNDGALFVFRTAPAPAEGKP